MGTRLQCREELTRLFGGQGFSQVYGYAPLDLKGANLVLCIYNNNSRHEFISAGFSNNFYTFFLDVFIKRFALENSEELLDDMHEVIRNTIRANITNPVWNELNLDTESECFFAEVAGVPYRVERHRLVIKVSSS